MKAKKRIKVFNCSWLGMCDAGYKTHQYLSFTIAGDNFGGAFSTLPGLKFFARRTLDTSVTDYIYVNSMISCQTVPDNSLLQKLLHFSATLTILVGNTGVNYNRCHRNSSLIIVTVV